MLKLRISDIASYKSFIYFDNHFIMMVYILQYARMKLALTNYDTLCKWCVKYSLKGTCFHAYRLFYILRVGLGFMI